MSGGSFNYLCYAVEDGEIFNRLSDLKSMERYVRGRGYHEVADEILVYIKDLETLFRRTLALGTRMQPLLHDIEWWASGDYGNDAIDRAWETFMFGTETNVE